MDTSCEVGETANLLCFRFECMLGCLCQTNEIICSDLRKKLFVNQLVTRAM